MATSHDNQFTLSMTGMSNLQFQISGHSITSGQPWSGITSITCNGDGSCTMNVEAGRKASAEVAAWFQAQVGNGSAIGTNTIDKMPTDLNFAFVGQMTFSHGGNTYTSAKGGSIVIAQGSGGGRNNWWLGGPGLSGVSVSGLGGAIGQNFNHGIIPSKVFFVVTPGEVSSMNMGLLST